MSFSLAVIFINLRQLKVVALKNDQEQLTIAASYPAWKFIKALSTFILKLAHVKVFKKVVLVLNYLDYVFKNNPTMTKR